MWRPIGSAVMGAATQTVTLGRVGAELTNGFLPMRITSQAGASLVPLSFGIVIPDTLAGNGGMPTGRYYPQAFPSIVQLGPGVLSSFDGVIRFRPRHYNLKWLEIGYPAFYWRIEAEVWAPVGLVTPEFSVYEWTDGGSLTFSITAERVGPSEAAPLAHD